MYKSIFLILGMLMLIGNSNHSLAQKIEEPPLCLKASATEISESQKSISVEVKITNITNKKVVIDKNSLKYGVIYTYDHGVFTSFGDVGSNYKGNYLILEPDQSYKESLKIEPREEFVKDDGKYYVRLVYGQFSEKVYEGIKVWRGDVKSNEIIIYLQNKNIVSWVEEKVKVSL